MVDLERLKQLAAAAIPGPWEFEHVDYFSALPGLEAGTFEIHNNWESDNWIAQTLTESHAELICAIPAIIAELEALRKNNKGWIKANGAGGWIDDLRRDKERLDILEAEMKREPLLLHDLIDGYHFPKHPRGLGLLQGDRTLRQAIDAMGFPHD